MNYHDLKKDELLKEVSARRSAGRDLPVNSQSSKEDIVTALELDDEDAAENTPDVEEGDIPQVEKKETVLPGEEVIPSGEFNKGHFISKADGEPYALAIIPDDIRGKTHKLKNSAHFWEGTEAEFKEAFDRK